MRVYAGTFDEELAERVAGDLKKAGVRTELRRALEIDVDGAYYMEGALSTLKEQYASTELHDVVLEWETNLEHARSVMKDGITENEFEEGVLDLVMPERARTKEFRKMLEEQLMKGELQIPDDDDEKVAASSSKACQRIFPFVSLKNNFSAPLHSWINWSRLTGFSI